MSNLPNEFTRSLDDNRVRPYTVGMTRHDETLSTIVLYTDNNEFENTDVDAPNSPAGIL